MARSPFRVLPPRRSPFANVRSASPFAPVSTRPPVTRSFGPPVNPGEAALFDLPPASYTMGLPPGVGGIPNDPSQLGLNALPQGGPYTMGLPPGTAPIPNDPSQLGLNALPQATANFDGSPIGLRRIDQGANFQGFPHGNIDPNAGPQFHQGFFGTGQTQRQPIDPSDALSRANDWRGRINIMAHHLAPGDTLQRARSQMTEFHRNEMGPAEAAFARMQHVDHVHQAASSLAQLLHARRPSQSFAGRAPGRFTT